MLVNFAGYWLFGLPVGYALCFDFGYGVYGLWWGLTLALVVIAIALLWLWCAPMKTVLTATSTK